MANAPTIENLLAGRLSVGIALYSGLSLLSDPPLRRFIQEQSREIRTAHAAALPPGYAYSRRLYKSFHVDPTKHRPSSEALWRRLRDRDDFPMVNPPVDLTNLLSLKYQVCYGLYDLGRLHGPVTIALGGAGDQYQGIRKETLNFSGKIVLRDDLGAFGNPSADSLRASVDESSRDIMLALFFHPDDPGKGRILSETVAAFSKFFAVTGSRSFFI